MTACKTLAASAASSVLLAACSGSDDPAPPPAAPNVTVRVLSSAAQQVTGGDARIEVAAPRDVQQRIELWLDGRRIEHGLRADGERMEGVVSGLKDGRNVLEVRLAGQASPAASLELVNHPITGPIFSGPQQQPFVCTVTTELGRQPLPEAGATSGFPVMDASGRQIGLSRDCTIEPVVTYQYRSTAGTWKPMPADGTRPTDLARTTLLDGREVDFVVRQERGTINRFIYSYAMLAPAGENAARPDLSLWNRRLLYFFQGGVAIGHSQGRLVSGALNPDVLGKGYAIAFSTGNNTGTHYNLQVAGETALMTKEGFVERYGVPLYTVGLGGSGGAIQQYVFAQNHPGLLDAALPVQSYPDMVTQTIHVGDCELLEHYMDVTDRANPKWQVTKNRTWLVGMNAEEGFAAVNDPLFDLKRAFGFASARGSTECIPAWRGLTPLAMNPLYGQAPNQQLMQPAGIMDSVRWTHYDDLRNIYGVDANGAARSTWDNVGVQYGLRSLKEGKVTPAEFLDVNAGIGGWKHPSEMVQEGFPFFGTGAAQIAAVQANPSTFDPWSRRNMRLSNDPNVPAPRTAGDLSAMRAAYTSGMVFQGDLKIPAIDHRQYLERELDMHNAHQSFAVRKRVTQKMGQSDNLVIWFTDTRPGQARASQSLEALAVMDEWMANIRANPTRTISQNKPARAVDACFDTQGNAIARGTGVWSGILDAQPAGACTQAFPLYSTSRIVAGAPIEGGIYKCALKAVDAAVADGTYAPWVPSAAEVARLKAIFPEGVCDYSRPDQARPAS